MSRRVFIVGATSAIAQAAARCFAEEGDRLILAGRDAVKLEAVACDLQVRGAESVRMLVGDLDDDSARRSMLSAGVAEWHGLDMALVAYGVLPDQVACESDTASLRAALETNYAGPAAWLVGLASTFESQASGVLAVIGSVAGDRGRRSNYVYGSAKAALDVFAAGLRLRLADKGVRVLTVKPGWVSTPMTAHMPQNFLYADPEAVGSGVYHAMIAGTSVVYVPSYWKWIMMAVRIIPEPIFRKLKL